MTGLLILWASLVFSTLFLLFSSEGEYSYFPFSDMLLNPQSYVYFLFEHVNDILVPVGVFLARQRTKALIIFVCIQSVDLLDYVLIYAEPWFDNLITYNTLKVAIFGGAIIYEKYGK